MPIDDLTKPTHERFRRAGYDQEEEYFYQKNREAIRALREQHDAQRRVAQSDLSRTLHWLKCPKCGADLRGHVTLRIVLRAAIKPLPTGIGQFPV